MAPVIMVYIVFEQYNFSTDVTHEYSCFIYGNKDKGWSYR